MKQIPIIDLFAGPGGLGEGFSSVTDENKNRLFKIKLSIEKDQFAHKTLELRSFFRQFPKDEVPDDYYEYVRNYNPSTDNNDRAKLFRKFPDEAKVAQSEAWLCTLGDENFPPEYVDVRIKNALHNEKDWVLIGGPPCQAFSLVGRSRNGGLHEDDHRVFLYREYLRIIAVHHPTVFVMENVKGLLSAKLDGNNIFKWIKSDLKNPGRLFPGNHSPSYKIYSLIKKPKNTEGDPLYDGDQDYLVKTEEYGVPQKRHRVILLGIREDVVLNEINVLSPEEKINLRLVIDKLPQLRSGIGREMKGVNGKGKNIYKNISDSNEFWHETITTYYEQIKNEFSDKIKFSLNGSSKFPQGSNYIPYKLHEPENRLKEWYHDSKLGGVLNHESRTHLKEDLRRYLFSSLYLQDKKDFPRLKDYPPELLPNHSNARGTKFEDRFRTQKPEEPATTITSHISKDGHYFIHYDPSQCRSLTVREAARIQTFPDNYFFCGARTAQYHQVGNAVPPYLAKQIAELIQKILWKH